MRITEIRVGIGQNCFSQKIMKTERWDDERLDRLALPLQRQLNGRASS
ncbi:hypothetical protein ACE1B6_27340 [Aerosakkonemataceae cyanobacterium BLCC-F154]|uniref:Uncharacterized protein n=1 Tax=Floridaenema fluviatile BLCC-F154 TaxID=3153640 RepID=A0ABV4YL76_9CYAN